MANIPSDNNLFLSSTEYSENLLSQQTKLSCKFTFVKLKQQNSVNVLRHQK